MKLPKLSSKLAHSFDPEVRARGAAYFSHGAVRLLSGSRSKVSAKVKGTEVYQVDLTWENGDLSLCCDCEYFDSTGPCKHLWATILAAQQKGFLANTELLNKVIEVGFEPLEIEEDPPPLWKKQLTPLTSKPAAPQQDLGRWPEKRQILYIVDQRASATKRQIVLDICTRDKKANGDFGRVAPFDLERSRILTLPVEDQAIMTALAGAAEYDSYGGFFLSGRQEVHRTNLVLHPLSSSLIPMAARTERLFLRFLASKGESLIPIHWDDAGPWQFTLKLHRGAKSLWVLEGVFKRGDQVIPLHGPSLITQGGLVFRGGTVAPLLADTPFDWLEHMRDKGMIEVPEKDLEEFLSLLLSTPRLPALELPAGLKYQQVQLQPQPCLSIQAASPESRSAKLSAVLSFNYDGREIEQEDASAGFIDPTGSRLLWRDPVFESEARGTLSANGLKWIAPTYFEPEAKWEFPAAKLPALVRTLADAGWHLTAEGKVFRRPFNLNLEVSSGLDWFELRGEAKFGVSSVPLPALLEALRRGEGMVRLDDGTFGMLPEEWLRRIGMIGSMGTTVKDHIRFRPSQAGLLGLLLASEPEVKFDQKFAQIRDQLQSFEGIKALPQPAGFVGQLRHYQCEGLGWMEFLRRFSFGGCLADDMGVGKTPQVLAMLESRRGAHGPSLVVLPRSLVFNWKQEAARFTPALKVLDFTGMDRILRDFAAYDLVLTTYGTLRRDVPRLKDVEFDYIVLDEAQAVKNASTEAAKSVRLLRSRHRLALSGTPVENHLGELWSLFEFLNPGMLGAASVFQQNVARGKAIDEDSRKILAQALRPFILRRTKEQVVRELPAKTEQTMYCEMAPPQRKLYDELRLHYRDSLLKRVSAQGLAKSKIMVLEALLRLRQAACHPGLIDVKRASESSAKLDALEDQLKEVLENGHKALVFSQFTSLLAILRSRLDEQGIVYEYLDGKTQNRQAKVDRFQSDKDCKLFLISLKAGGVGLNLTAAEYVFLLDPWWNPAVEAQAVDRAHRIGQSRAVFAYRLIARDTVEEKVLELQKTKRNLADSIIREDNSLLRDLRREDLELLLS